MTGAAATPTMAVMLYGPSSRLALIGAFVLGAASCSGDDGGGEAEPAGGSGTTNVGGGGRGGSSGDRGGSTGGGGRTSSGGNSAGSPSGEGGEGTAPGAAGMEAAGGSAVSGECGRSLATQPCQGQGHCEWTNETVCETGYCDCNDGSWACVWQQTNDCGGVCPAPQEAECGASCSGMISNCQCSCGGPNYSGCSCVDGAWACLGCN